MSSVSLPPTLFTRPLHQISPKMDSPARQDIIIILGSNAYPNAVDRMTTAINHLSWTIEAAGRECERLGPVADGEAPKVTSMRKDNLW